MGCAFQIIFFLKTTDMSVFHFFKFPQNKRVLKNYRFPDTAAAAGAGGGGRTLKSRSRPLPTHPGSKYFREGDPRCRFVSLGELI